MGRVSSSKGDNVLTQVNLLEADYARRLQVPATYTVWEQDSIYYADHCLGTGTDYSDADPIVVLNACRDNGPAEGTSVYIKPPFVTGSQFTINRANFTLFSDIHGLSGAVQIYRVLIDSTSVNISEVTLQGILMQYLRFNAVSSHSIIYSYFIDNYVRSAGTATSEGIVFDGDGTDEINNIYFVRNKFYDQGQSARAGFVSWLFNHVGNGQIYFDHCNYSGNASNQAFFAVEDDGFLGPYVRINDFNCVPGASATWRLLLVKAQTSNNNRGVAAFDCSGAWFELAPTTTNFVEVENSTKTVRCAAYIHNNTLSPSGANRNICNILNATWYAAPGGVDWVNNRSRLAYTLGTPAHATNFRVHTVNNWYYNPIGNVATPYSAGAGYLRDSAGAQAHPSNATLYTVVESPKLINIGGGTISAILIDGVATGFTSGTFALSPRQTFQVNWTVQPTISTVYAQ
jgi:hypothetical protein